MVKGLTKLGLCLVLGLLVWGPIPSGKADLAGQMPRGACFAQSPAEERPNDEKPDLRWFREEMKISPRYLEKSDGVLGMSWTHFFTMLFLVLFFIAAIATLFMRHRRIKQILNLLLIDEKRPGAES